LQRVCVKCQACLMFDDFLSSRTIARCPCYGWFNRRFCLKKVSCGWRRLILPLRLCQSKLQKARSCPCDCTTKQANLSEFHLGGEKDHRLRHTGFKCHKYFVQWWTGSGGVVWSTLKRSGFFTALIRCRRAIDVIQVSDKHGMVDFYALWVVVLVRVDLHRARHGILICGLTGDSWVKQRSRFEHIKARGTRRRCDWFWANRWSERCR